MVGASPAAAGASMRSAGASIPLRARCVPTTLSPVARKRAASTNAANFFFRASLSLVKGPQRCAWCNRVCLPRLLAKAQVLCWRNGPFGARRADRSGHLSRLSETSLNQKMRFGLHLARAPTLGGPRLIAWSQPSSHRQHGQHRRRHPILHVRSVASPSWGESVCRRFDAPIPSAVDATLEAALCSWGDEGPAPARRRRRDAPEDKRT